ncbi:hypothetical protein QGM71_12150 [Virgibacillus sp. C22-A2]|uniref:Uncharacterized protein n=1 Tax=Virgibacillus tibetensis TaxID=3042313 RepID=A0ABU6KG04_9BACI|nr:hypothetical protein [Virgibacillus sp. C22-A2]
MVNDHLWLLINKVVGDYIPHMEELADSEDALELSILSLLIQLKMKNLNVPNKGSEGKQTMQQYGEVLEEINQTIENNQKQFNELLDLLKKTE